MLLSRNRVTVDLAQERWKRNLSQRTAARSIGVSLHTLQRAEYGESVSPVSAKKISDFFAVRVEDWHPKLRRKDLPQ